MKTETKDKWIKKIGEAKSEGEQQTIIDEFMRTSSELSEEEDRLAALEDLLSTMSEVQVKMQYLSNVNAENGLLMEYSQNVIDELQTQIDETVNEMQSDKEEIKNGKKKY
jgi:hypothetical protein